MAKRVGQRFRLSFGDAALLFMASPVYALRGAVRLVRRIGFARMSHRRTLDCRTCGNEILLLGFWRCGCGFTWRGHLLRLCPVCETLPQVIRCEHCGATEKVQR